jgi:RNA polymerase sigma factor (sigma-70 family)
MVRRWFRVLARKCSPGSQFPSPVPPRRRPRTLLRLEAVEDRTVASTVQDEPPASLPVAHEAQLGPAPEPVTGTTGNDQAQGGDHGASIPGPHQKEPLAPVVGDAPVLMADGVPPATTTSTSFSGPARLYTDLRLQVAADATRSEEIVPRPAVAQQGTSAETSAQANADANGVSPVGSDRGQAPAVRSPAAADGRDSSGAQPGAAPASPAPVSQEAPRGQPVRVSGGATDAAVRSRPDNSVPEHSASNGIVRPSNTPVAPASRVVSPRLSADLPDGALLHRFVTQREQAAFTALVQRHGSFVFGVCQRVLRDFHAAQDATQATFLVLARKAGMLDRNSPLGGWLYRVAYHLALRSRGVAGRQRVTENEAGAERASRATSDVAADLEQRELQQVIREELQGLPEKYRTPLSLCYFGDRSHAEAAREIGLPRGSMAKRIGEGLDRLRERLLDRGFML